MFIKSVKQKSAYWHFNNALIEDAAFGQGLLFFWMRWRSQKPNFTSIQQWWDIGKLKIEKLCNQYTSNVTGDTLQNISNLEIDILELQGLCGAHRDLGQIQTLKDKKS